MVLSAGIYSAPTCTWYTERLRERENHPKSDYELDRLPDGVTCNYKVAAFERHARRQLLLFSSP